MKKTILLTILLTILSSMAWAQPYQSVFGDNSTSFNILIIDPGLAHTDSVYSTGMSVFDNMEYHSFDGSSTGFMYYLRANEDNSKVYEYLDDTEYLVMDLTLQKGDTFVFYKQIEPVNIVDTVYLKNGLKHIGFNRSIYVDQNEKITFIEGIGPNIGFFNGHFGEISDQYLLCSYKNDTLSYSNYSEYFKDICSFWAPISNDEKEVVNNKVYPTIFDSRITVVFQQEQQLQNEIVIVSPRGEVLFKKQTNNSVEQIALTQLAKGTYFVIINKQECVPIFKMK